MRGKDGSKTRTGRKVKDHPRTCGEKSLLHPSQLRGRGSPPHMRGKVFVHRHNVFRKGITPAHAGKSFASGFVCHPFGDHPRTCGEKSSGCRMYSVVPGSPPHMRGKVQKICQRYRVGGITPAHAGKRRTDSKAALPHEDHPRTCGEKTKKIP